MTEISCATDDGVDLRIRVDGPDAGTPVLLLNSLGTDLSMWDEQVRQWSRERCVIRFDQRGHGASGVPPGPYTIERLGRDAVAVIGAVGLGQVDLCGISLGGQVALWLAAHEPALVRRVVLADTAMRIGTEPSWRSRAEVVRRAGVVAVADLVLDRFFSERFRVDAPMTVQRARAQLLATDPEGYAASCEAIAVADLQGEAATVCAPTLVVVGGVDVATTTADARALHAALSTSCYVEVPAAGHLVNLERPLQFAAIVGDFLNSGDGQRA